MFTPKSFRWRKATDIDRECAVFELLADEKAILDAGFSSAGVFEIVFNNDVAGLLIDLASLEELLEDGRKLAELDRQ